MTADIDPDRADFTIDIERIAIPDQSFDAILCFHVLEHVNDRMALSELHRVLRPDGILLLITPVIEGWSRTYEDCAVQSPEDRELYFGQSDHVRVFGTDIRERIRDAGFSLSEFTAEEPEVSKNSLKRGTKVFICRR